MQQTSEEWENAHATFAPLVVQIVMDRTAQSKKRKRFIDAKWQCVTCVGLQRNLHANDHPDPLALRGFHEISMSRDKYKHPWSSLTHATAKNATASPRTSGCAPIKIGTSIEKTETAKISTGCAYCVTKTNGAWYLGYQKHIRHT